jgi:hypothetical protein
MFKVLRSRLKEQEIRLKHKRLKVNRLKAEGKKKKSSSIPLYKGGRSIVLIR